MFGIIKNLIQGRGSIAKGSYKSMNDVVYSCIIEKNN